MQRRYQKKVNLKNKNEVINKTASETKRVELNQALANNERMKLGLSRKNWKRYKKWHALYTSKLHELTGEFMSKLLENGLEIGADGSELIFHYCETKWKFYIKPLMHKLKLHNSKERVKVLNKFTEIVEDLLNKDNEAKKARAKIKKKSPKEIVIEKIMKIAFDYYNYELPKDVEAEIENEDTVSILITKVKSGIPRGKKMLFEKQAREILKFSGVQ